MTSLRLSRLSRADVLETISSERLRALLKPFQSFFAKQGVSIEAPTSLDCHAILRAIQEAEDEPPAELLEAICLIDELANAATVDLLLDRVSTAELGLEPGGENSAADVITAAWLQQREQLIQTHVRARSKRVRSFDYFQANQSRPPKFSLPSRERQQQLEREIDFWYVERFRGQGTKVEIYDSGQEVDISILHGSLFRRQPVVNAGIFGVKSFWPVQCDLVVYNRAFGELRINAKSAKEKALYCRLLGKHLFDNEECFPTGIKYSLEPLREYGFAALSPGDSEEICDARLVELWLGDPDDRYGVITIRKGEDLFDWAQARNKDIHIQRRLISATFKLRFNKRKGEVAVTLRPPNVAIYNRGPVSAAIEAWLTQRGFIVTNERERNSNNEPALARTREAG